MKWSKEDVDYLEKNYSTNPNMKEMCEKLKRHKRAVQHKGARLSLSRHTHLSRVYPGRTPRNIIERRYYEKHKESRYKKKRERINKRNEEFKKLLGGKCKFCSYNKCLAALDFHHFTEDKEGNVSRIIKDLSKQKGLKEIRKCILLCANCHRELHHKG